MGGEPLASGTDNGEVCTPVKFAPHPPLRHTVPIVWRMVQPWRTRTLKTWNASNWMERDWSLSSIIIVTRCGTSPTNLTMTCARAAVCVCACVREFTLV
jgi:hypothetical protein